MPIKTRKIKGFGGRYSITSKGNVLSGRKHLKARTEGSGYKRVNLKYKGTSKTVRVHILVAKHFVKKGKPNQTFVGHMDGDKTNNTVSNLKMQSPSENNQHAHDTGLYGRYSCKVRKHLRKGKNKVSVVRTHKRKKK